MIPAPALLDELAERIAEAPRGLIVAGRQLDPDLGGPVGALAEAAGYPVLAEPTSQLRWGPERPASLVPSYDLIARERPAGLEPELIVRFGDMPTSKALRLWLAAIPGLRQIVVDPHGDWKEPTRRAETVLRADPAALAEGLSERLKASAGARRIASAESGEPWSSRWTDAGQRVENAVLQELEDAPELNDNNEPAVWLELASNLRDGDQVLAASSMPVRDQEAFLPSGRARVRFLANRGANGIDGLISTAAGAAAASGARTWAVLGDLAFAHDLGGLALRPRGAPAATAGARQRRRRDLPLPTPGRCRLGAGVRGAARHPVGAGHRRAAELFGLEAAPPGTPMRSSRRWRGPRAS